MLITDSKSTFYSMLFGKGGGLGVLKKSTPYALIKNVDSLVRPITCNSLIMNTMHHCVLILHASATDNK